MTRPQIHPDVRRQWGRKLREAREAAGFARQRDLGDALGVGAASVCRWETGQVVPSDAMKVRIAELVHRNVEDLYPLSRGTGVIGAVA